jgi:hypothetical protein
MAVKKKKSTTKKVVAPKAVKKSVKKKPATKKAAARKVVKKRVKKKAPVKKVKSRIKPAHATMDSHSMFTDVPISKSFKDIYDVIEKTSRGTPITPSKTPAASKMVKKTGDHRSVAIIALLLVLGFGGFILANNPSLPTEIQSDVLAQPQAVAPITKPIAVPTREPITTLFTYTSTGIRLAWSVKGIDVESIQISSAENDQDFMEVKTLTSAARSLDFTKIDTSGWTKFQVTTTSTQGQTFSSTVGLRGSFTI